MAKLARQGLMRCLGSGFGTNHSPTQHYCTTPTAFCVGILFGLELFDEIINRAATMLRAARK